MGKGKEGVGREKGTGGREGEGKDDFHPTLF